MKKLKLASILSLIAIGTVFCQTQPLFDYYSNGERILSNIEQDQYNQLIGSGNYSEIKIASVRSLSDIKVGKVFNVNYSEVVKTLREDYFISKENGEYQISGVLGEDDGGDGYTNFTCTYHINYGVTGSIMNDLTQEFYQIIPINKLEGEEHIKPEVFICKWIPLKYIGSSGCSTPTSEPDPEDGDDVDDELELDSRSNCNRNIRILFLFTNRAAVSGINPSAVANAIVAELNTAVMASRVNPQPLVATYENAGAVNIPSFITTNDMGADLNRLVNDSIAQSLRDINFADLVVLLTNQTLYTIAGRAKDIKTSNANAYSIAQIRAAAFGFTASHEIGHMMGCRHQRCSTCGGGFLGLTNGCDEFTRGHGYDLCGNSRTIMYQNGCDSRTRVGRISNQDSPFMGCSSGNFWNNNIRSMRRHACDVADFRPRPVIEFDEFTIMIDGPAYGNLCNWSEWKAIISDESSPLNTYIYKWEKSTNGYNNWCTISTSPTINNFQLFNSCYTSNSFYLRLQVRLATNQSIVEFDQKFISWSSCVGNEEDLGSRSVTSKVEEVKVYPNPTTDYIIVENIDEIIGVFDSNGKQAPVSKALESNGVIIDCRNWIAGTYFIVFNSNNKIETKKIVKE